MKPERVATLLRSVSSTLITEFFTPEIWYV